MLVRTIGSAVYGVDAISITIEVNVSNGRGYFIVGLPDNAVKESLQRIEALYIPVMVPPPFRSMVTPHSGAW